MYRGLDSNYACGQRKIDMNAANHVVRGGVCISLNMQGMNAVMKDAQTRWSRVEEFVRHGAKVKRCSREGCTNQVQEEKLGTL